MTKQQNFEEKYNELFIEINQIDITKRAYMPGVQRTESSIFIDFYNRKIILNENDIIDKDDEDEMMPANACYLFQESAGKHLDIESLTVLCTYLTGQLIS